MGDRRVLCRYGAFARAWREALRETDILGRFGGEEFLLLMPETPVELAVASRERH